MPHRLISKSVVKRLPVYLRILDNLIRRDIEIISSKDLSAESGFSAEQIRKDFAYFGAFGTRGTGYNTVYLRDQILKIIGLDKKTNVVVIGAGHLGTALTRYNASKNSYVQIAAVLDNDPDLIGRYINGIPIRTIKDLPSLISLHQIKVALITVPAEAAQGVVDEIIGYGIKAILNFAPVKLRVPADVHVSNADLTMELQSLIYYSSAEVDRHSRLQQEHDSKGLKTLTLE